MGYTNGRESNQPGNVQLHSKIFKDGKEYEKASERFIEQITSLFTLKKKQSF